MKFTIERNWIDVVGTIWMPEIVCGQRIDLRAYDIENMRNKCEVAGCPCGGLDAPISRWEVEQWLATNAGDFQRIQDFYAVVGEVEIEWATEEGELAYDACFAEA